VPWQRVGTGDDEAPHCQSTQDRRLGVSKTTIETQLAKVRHRIEQQHASDEVPRLGRYIDLVDDVEQKLAQLRARLDVVERSLAVDASGDWATYVAAVTAELESWDTYLERLQTTIATREWHTREQAEAEIRDVRGHRIVVDERLAQARDAAGNGWQEQRERVSAARGELEQKADELSAKLS
jgi:hypothetical protein